MADDDVGVLVQENCGFCDLVKEMPEVKEGKIKQYNINTKEGAELAKKLNAEGTPTFFTKDAKGNLTSCDHDVKDDGTVVFKCPIDKKTAP